MLAAALFVLCALAANAADITGKWVAQMPGRDGSTSEWAFNLKQAGETLTGTVTSPRGDQEISEGKVAGDAVSFVTVMSFGDMQMKWVYKGAIAGNEIKFTRSMEGGGGGGRGPMGPQEFIAKKAS
jgi:hypothetical protein